MMVGAGKAPIELDGIVPFDGFDSVRHELQARALVVESNGNRACILSLEMTSMSDMLLQRLAQVAETAASCRAPYLWIVPTHTFSAPHVRTPEHLVSDDERARNARYLDALLAAAQASIEKAASALASARVELARGHCPVNVNRDVETPAGWWLGADSDGYSDKDMPVVRFVREDGSTAAVLATADVQSSVLDGSHDSEGARVVSADLFGFAANKLEDDLDCVAMLLPGAAGDQAPRQKAVVATYDGSGVRTVVDAHEAAYGMLHEQGAALAMALEDALLGACELPGGDLEARCVSVILPAQERADFHSLAPRRHYEFVAAGERSTDVHVLKLGGLSLVGVQPEVSSSFGTVVRNQNGNRTLLVTLVNGGAKYLPAPDAYEKITYEAMNSGFARGSYELLLNAILDALASA